MKITKRVLAAGDRFDIIEVEPHGYTVLRLADLASVDFFGDDATERFRHLFAGDESPMDLDDNEGCADAMGDALTEVGEFPDVPPLKTWSLIINWADDDLEQGNYAWSGDACTSEAAERMARWDMWWQEHGDEKIVEGDISDEFGSVVECYPGNIWQADELAGKVAALEAERAEMLAALQLSERLIVLAYGEPPEVITIPMEWRMPTRCIAWHHIAETREVIAKMEGRT